MKPVYILNLVLIISVVVLCIKLAMTSNPVGNLSETVMKTITTRTSIRKYQDKPVEKEIINQLLRAAMSAPSAMNKQPWHFVVVTKKEVLLSLALANPYAKMVAHAPLAIVICGDMNKTIEGQGRDFWVQDASATTENLLIAAHAFGLGAVWTGIFPLEERCEAVKQILHLPDHLIPLNTIVIGYPDENPKPKDKFNTENISYDIY